MFCNTSLFQKDHAVAAAFEEPSAFQVGCLLSGMLATVQLDNELWLEAAEVGNEWPDAHLATELHCGDLA